MDVKKKKRRSVDPKRKREMELRELERLMSSADTYERRGGKVKQRRRATE